MPAARSIEAVLDPSRFEPFAHIRTADAFAAAWADQRDGVLAGLSHAAYLPGPWVKTRLRPLGASFVRTYDREGAQAFLAAWPERAVLSFRGTEPRGERAPSGILLAIHAFLERVLRTDLPDELCSLLFNDVLADLKFHKRELVGASVHRGFLGEVRKLWEPAILLDLQSRLAPGVPVYATGHSLGGAMAVLAAMLHPFEGVVTFGQPRVGSGLSNKVRSAFYRRYVNGLDPVARLPPRAWPFEYEDQGERVDMVDREGSNVLYDHSIVDYAAKLGF